MKRLVSTLSKKCLRVRRVCDIAHAASAGKGIALVLGCIIFILVGSGNAFAQILDGFTYLRPEYDPTQVECAVDSLFQLIEGAFGALVMVVAGLGAIVAAAMGAYRASVGMLVVAIGAFILRAMVSLFFGDFGPCDIG